MHRASFLPRLKPLPLYLWCRLLIRRQRLAQAELKLSDAIADYPRHAGLLRAAAVVAQNQGRYAEAAERWCALCDLQPDLHVAWGNLAACQRLLHRLPDASRSVARALALAPEKAWLKTEAARIFDQLGEPERSAPIWTELLDRPGASAEIWQGFIEAELRLGHLDVAERALATASSRFPAHRNIHAARGAVAMYRDDWEAASDIWSRYATHYPDDWVGGFYRERAATMLQFERAERQLPQPSYAPVAVGHVEDESLRQLMLRFESLGEDCEFGSVQRRYGAEPLGLLRWNDTSYPNLAAALEQDFAGCGAPETTVLDVGEIDEVYVRDRRWDLGMHTFLFAREVSLETLFPKMCRRLVFLRDKFIDDLAEGAKILVFKSDAINIRELQHLHSLLRATGPARLLHVRHGHWAGLQGWPRGEPGEVKAISRDLFVGYISWMGDLEDICFDEWVGLCRSAVEATARDAHRLDGADATPRCSPP